MKKLIFIIGVFVVLATVLFGVMELLSDEDDLPDFTEPTNYTVSETVEADDIEVYIMDEPSTDLTNEDSSVDVDNDISVEVDDIIEDTTVEDNIVEEVVEDIMTEGDAETVLDEYYAVYEAIVYTLRGSKDEESMTDNMMNNIEYLKTQYPYSEFPDVTVVLEVNVMQDISEIEVVYDGTTYCFSYTSVDNKMDTVEFIKEY